ncbi:MAG: hypothetical protein WAV30_04960 [Microgenomates group bacterium]
MPQQQPHKNNKKEFTPFLLLFLPFLVLLDIIVYFMTRSSCWNCFGINDFLRDSSITFHLLSQALPFLNKKIPDA